jgi:hypothetical protein
MRVPKFNRLAATMIAIISLQTANAQQISAADKNAAIQQIAKQIAANYIDPEKGGQIASHIQTANFKGMFDKATTWKDFDEMVTKELREFSQDGRLCVMYGASQTQGPVDMIQESRVLEGNIGYLKVPTININRNNVNVLYDAMKKMQGTKALIIDLRDNGGGGSEIGPVFESFFLPPGTATLQFTTRDRNFTIDSTVSWLKEKTYEHPVYILVNRKTASAAEAFAFVLQQNRRAKIVGERSAGAAYMNSWYPVDDKNYVSVSTSAPSIPGNDISWEQTGVQPDIKVKKGDALEAAVREASRA